MGVDIQTYRARIGAYNNSKAGNISKGDAAVNLRTGMKAVGCLVFIGVLLVMAGIEVNPGPKGKDDDRCQSNEVQGRLQYTDATVQDTQHNLGTDHIPLVQVSGFSEQLNVNKEMLELYFQNEAKNGGGKIKSIDIWDNKKLATITFEDRTAVDAFMKKKPKNIFGIDVSITIIELTRIRITGLLANVTEEMLEMFFEREKKEGGGKVKSIYIDRRKRCVLVEFEDEKGVQSIMKKTPMSILGMKVEIEVVGRDVEELKMIKLTKLSKYINDEMLRIFFENNEDYDGKVVDVRVNSEEHFAIVEFAESADVYKVANKGTLTICGFKVDVDVFDETELLEQVIAPLIKISGFTASMNKEMLGMFFENEERKGGGKVKHIEFDDKNRCAAIAFEEKSAVDAFMQTKPRSILGMEVKIEIMDETEILGPIIVPLIKISGFNTTMNKEMLGMFFENEERKGGGKVKHIEFDGKNRCATIAFEEKSAVDALMQTKPKSILGMEVKIEVIDTASKMINAKNTKVKISGLMENTNEEMLLMFFQNEERQGGGKVKEVIVDNKNKSAVIEFEEQTGVEWIIKKTPLSIFGMSVQIEELGENIREFKKILLSKLPDTFNDEMIKMFFENDKECGGAKVVDVVVNSEEHFAVVEFDDFTAVHRVMDKVPFKIFGFEVDVDVFDESRNLETSMNTSIRISGSMENINKDMLEMFFEVEERNGGGKVKSIDIDYRNNCTIVTFIDKTGVKRIIETPPKEILGVDVEIEEIDSKQSEGRPNELIVKGIPGTVSEEISTMTFENDREQGDGNVKNVNIDQTNTCGVDEFENAEDTPYKMSSAKNTKIKISGLMENINEEMLLMFFQNEERQGGGKVKEVNVDNKNKSAVIEFEEQTGVEWIVKKTPLSIFGMSVQIEELGENIKEFKKIILSKLPDTFNDEILQMFFENDKECGGAKVVDVVINSEEHFAVVEFDDFTAVQRVMDKVPLKIFGFEVDADVFDSKQPEERPTELIVKGISGTVSEEISTLTFENDREQSDGTVVNTIIDQSNNCEMIEFGNAEVQSLPSDMTGRSEERTEMSDSKQPEERPTELIVKGIPGTVSEEISTLTFVNDREQSDGNVINAIIEQSNNCKMVEFGNAEDSHQTELLVKGIPRTVSEEILTRAFENERDQGDGNVKNDNIVQSNNCGMVEFENAEGQVLQIGNSGQNKNDSKPTNPEQIFFFSDNLYSESKTFYQMLQMLELSDKYPGKISTRDIVTVDPNEWNEHERETIKLSDIPRLVLKRLLCSNSESRDVTVTDEDKCSDNFELGNTMSFISDTTEDKEDISPLDVFHIVFQCCDPFLKQIIVQKLYLCKLAVPFLYTKWDECEKSVSMLSIWPLRSLAIENNQIPDCKSKVTSKEIDILELSTNMVAFGRLGRPSYSKSKLLNNLLTSQGCKTFFNIDSPSGMTSRKLSNGQIEMFWLPTVGEKKDRFQKAMTFLNIRGDIGHNFDTETISFIAEFVDAIAIIIDKGDIINHGKDIKNILLKFYSVILIIANPLNSETFKAIKCFEDDVLSCKQEMKLRILSTHKGNVEQNVVDMVSTITKHISNQLKSNCTKSYKERYKQGKVASIKTDEEEIKCQNGKNESIKMIDFMKSACSTIGWKLHLTPVHSKYSKTLGKLMKDREREKNFTSGNNIDVMIEKIRKDQTQSITKAVKLFIDILIKLEGSPISIKYFLSWLHIDIEKEKRLILPSLMQENRQAWQKLKVLKSKKTQVQSDIEEQENNISKLEEKIDDASFSVEHFIREIGHINDAILELGNDCTDFGLPPLSQISNIVGHLVADGYQFELIDGESFYMPYKWICEVVKQVDQCISFGKVLTLSILGLQSSGKSTFLNTMFGCQFSTRTGKCTRGIHFQLFPAHTAAFQNKLSDYDYILVVDTEGLRSPELSHVQHEHDNELATVITGIGDITIIIIMGENTSEIRDILVIVHAFLRLKMTNKELDMRKSCSFIHQNVADTSASENMMSGLSKTIQTLDEMTKESARNEGIINITSFNQVIEFDINSQVWYVKNLWQGNPPMAQVNTEYSEKVLEIKSSIMQKALTMKDKSYKSLIDITEQSHNLWKGVLTEDFVFSFRNSIEIKAYMAMEHVVQNELWRLESFIRDKLILVSQNGFINCNQKENLSNLADGLIQDLNNLLLDERQKSENITTEYFENDKYKDIIIQWKASQERRFAFVCEKLEKTISGQIERSLAKRLIEILTDNCHKEHEEELRISSMKVAAKYKDQKLSNQDIDILFNGIWSSFVKKINTPFSSSEKNKRKMSEMFHTCLKNIFKENHAVLKNVLEKSKNLTPLQNLTNLKGTFSLTGIDNNDINFTWYQKGKNIVTGSKDVMKYIEKRVDQVFENIDEMIKVHCQVREEITDLSVNKMMHELVSSIDNILKGDFECKFQKPFYVKIFVHVSRHAQAIFEKHNEHYFTSYGTAARLEKYRVQQKISFEAHLNCRLSEDVVSKLFTNIIESFAEEWIIQTISNEVFVELHSHLPSVKNRVIIEICTDLLDNDISERMSRTTKGNIEKIINLQKENFYNFRRYMHTPKEYAHSWITRKALDHLFAPKSRAYANISKRLVRRVFSVATNCVIDLCDANDKKSPIPIIQWTKSFRTLMAKSEFSITLESLRSVEKATQVIQNIEYLTKEILESLKKSEEKLTSRFKNTSSENIQWANSNPIDSVVQKIWGCQEQCAYCGEPCAKNENHCGSDHFSLQHRPLCGIGIRYKQSKTAVLESCEFKIQTNETHTCDVFKYVCNDQKQHCGKEHCYKNYRAYFKEWHIAPTSNILDSSKFWMWFVATYKENLQIYYSYKFDSLPSSWTDVTKDQALQSLKETYPTLQNR